ncbi:hypothetical protein BGZ60DRAFT_530328 [Tricladium varicosporioides]|nr:hypothetical protein BGZ60DRAFT_530328 [Hymenoscyphus varicosporioides]
MAPKFNILKLPQAIVDQIEGNDTPSSGKRSFHQRPSTRKDLRKATRNEKKSLRSGPPPLKRTKIQRDHRYSESEDDQPAFDHAPKAAKSVRKEAQALKPKTIPKITKKANLISSKSLKTRSPSPPVPISRAVRAKLQEDDNEIAALEKKLGLKGKKKLPQSFVDDGLDVLLEGLDEAEPSEAIESKKRKAEGDKWLEKKRSNARQKSAGQAIIEEGQDLEEDEDIESWDRDSEGSDDDGASDMSLDDQGFPDDILDEASNEDEELDTENDFDGFTSDELENKPRVPQFRENPYVAPTGDKEAPAKYIPPSLRTPSGESGDLVRLRRQTQGLINKLTEANLVSILASIEKLYRDHPRQHVTSTLVDLLLTSVSEPTSLPDTLIILPAGFIAAIYRIIGMDFGAQVIQRTVELFDEHYERACALKQTGRAAATSNANASKETSNLIMLLSEMYNFQVVGSNLIFDYIKLFLRKLSELNAELLLKIIRTSGPQLRQDDPSSLKDIVAMLRPALLALGENVSVRTKFMIETINDLKNNRLKAGGVTGGITSEHTIRMKKTLGTLNTRSVKASEPLRVGLKDIKDSDKKGKWWLVGASWAGIATEETNEDVPVNKYSIVAPQIEDPGTSDLGQLAREQRMNTDVRRAIFITVMSATDFQDAYLKLLKLKLKKVQEYEIPKVLIHCAGAEKSYNPYYTLIAQKICGDRRLKTAFQYCLWDLFRKMDESDEDEVTEDNEAIDTRQLVNLAKMFGTLIVEGGLGLGVLKNLNLVYLRPKTKIFMEVLFITILLQSQRGSETKRDEQAVVSIISRVKNTPQLVTGLQYLLRKVVRKTDIAGGKEEKATVRWACKIAGNTLEALVAVDTAKD